MSKPGTQVGIVRYGELEPCRTAFIDAHTPRSDAKENFAIVGAGVSESAQQHVHIEETPGFNVGAAGQPPHCRNSLHVHRTAEVFFVHKGRWRFFWGLRGTAGDLVLEEGDIFDIPTGIFRGFENVGTDYGLLMAILGGDDAGGGVIWAPQVIEEAKAHGLVLAQTGRLYDTTKGERLPAGVEPMPCLSEEDLERFAEPPVEALVPAYVGRYQDLMARSSKRPARVIGVEGALIRDRPGFEVDFLSRPSIPPDPYCVDRHEVLMVHRGHWRLTWADGETVLAPGDTCIVPPGLERSLGCAMSGESALFRVRGTGDPAGPTWRP